MNAYARGLGAARHKDIAAAKAEIAGLTQLRAAMAAQKKDYWIEQADIQIDTVGTWIANAAGNRDDALQRMRLAELQRRSVAVRKGG